MERPSRSKRTPNRFVNALSRRLTETPRPCVGECRSGAPCYRRPHGRTRMRRLLRDCPGAAPHGMQAGPKGVEIARTIAIPEGNEAESSCQLWEAHAKELRELLYDRGRRPLVVNLVPGVEQGRKRGTAELAGRTVIGSWARSLLIGVSLDCELAGPFIKAHCRGHQQHAPGHIHDRAGLRPSRSSALANGP